VSSNKHIKKPLLAATCEDLSSIKYPVAVTPKIDGIRCLIVNGKAVTRKLKPIPNNHIRTLIEKHGYEGMDGEIYIPNKSFNEIQSLVMTEDGTPYFEYIVFDLYSDASYVNRLLKLEQLQKILPDWIVPLFYKVVSTQAELEAKEQQYLRDGYEGIMIRDLDGPYKFGRSTVKQGILLKWKRFKDAEATVIGFVEKLHNNNEATVSELGYTKRSSHKVNLTPAGTLGALVVKAGDIEFSVGSGFDDETRQEIWDNQKKYIGKLVKYRYQASGMLERPRFPIFLGFRDERDT
jgi:DNA ligase-1